MSERTAIEWTDSTWNSWFGCTKVGPGCDHCYAEKLMDKRLGRVRWGAGQPRVRTSAANWRKPIEWNRWQYFECGTCRWRGSSKKSICLGTGAFRCPQCFADPLTPTRRRVFCASLADVFDNEVDPTWRADLFELIRATPNLDWLLLTKRIGNVRPMLEELKKKHARYHQEWAMFDSWLGGEPPTNVWLGATICNQAEADRDIPKLRATPAAVQFLSIEPMLSAVDLNAVPPPPGTRPINGATMADISGCLPRWQKHPMRAKLRNGVDWVIAGGESGLHARPAHPDWFRALRDQCAAAGVPFLFKQWGEWLPAEADGDLPVVALDGSERCLSGKVPFDTSFSDYVMARAGKKTAGRLLDGREHNEFPVHARPQFAGG